MPQLFPVYIHHSHRLIKSITHTLVVNHQFIAHLYGVNFPSVQNTSNIQACQFRLRFFFFFKVKLDNSEVSVSTEACVESEIIVEAVWFVEPD